MLWLIFLIVISAIRVLTLDTDSVVKNEVKGVTIENKKILLIDSIETLDTLSTTTIKQLVQETFGTSSIMVRIASCESHFRQFNKDGTVRRGVQNNKDVGVLQINEYYHQQAALKLGYDIHTLRGNLLYGKYLFDKEGSTPWNWSKPMWSKGECKS